MGPQRHLSWVLIPTEHKQRQLAGQLHQGDTASITIFDAGLSGGTKQKNYPITGIDTTSTIASGLETAINSDSSLSAIGITATAFMNTVDIKSTSTNATTYSQSVTTPSGSPGTETVTLCRSTGVVQAFYNNLNEMKATGPGGPTTFSGTTNKPVKSASINSCVVNIHGKQSVRSSSDLSDWCSGYAVNLQIVPGAPGYPPASPPSFIVSNPSNQAGNQFVLTVGNTSLPLGEATVNYTTSASDTQATTMSL